MSEVINGHCELFGHRGSAAGLENHQPEVKAQQAVCSVNPLGLVIRAAGTFTKICPHHRHGESRRDDDEALLFRAQQLGCRDKKGWATRHKLYRESSPLWRSDAFTYTHGL